MKRIISAILTLVLIIMIGSVSFAAPGDAVIPDPDIPEAQAEDVIELTYLQPLREIGNQEIPGSASVVDEQLPKGDSLPKTGGIPAETFYVAGVLIIAAALVILKKTKAAPKS